MAAPAVIFCNEIKFKVQGKHSSKFPVSNEIKLKVKEKKRFLISRLHSAHTKLFVLKGKPVCRTNFEMFVYKNSKF